MGMKVAPDADRKPLLKEGEYGLGGEAVLNSIKARGVMEKQPDGSWAASTTDFYIDFGVQVDDADQGRVFLNTGGMGKFHTRMASSSGSMAPLFLANLGLNSATVEFDENADEKGNHALLGENPCPMKVVVTVAVDKYKDKSGEQVEKNSIKSIAALN
jgi:hypothetical protein